MATLQYRVLLFRQGRLIAEFDDITFSTVRFGIDDVIGTAEIRLNNRNKRWVRQDNNEFYIRENDVVRLYARSVTDAATYEQGIISSANLLMVADIKELTAVLDNNKTEWILSCVDKSYSFLNKLWSFNYTTAQAKTAPEIIKDVLLSTTGNANGVNTSAVRARLVSEGGYIEDTRSDGSAFPPIEFTKDFKPVIEWIRDLSQPENTNSQTEILNGTFIEPRPFFFYVDENNEAHWERRNPEESPAMIVSVGATGPLSVTHPVTRQTVADTETHIVYSHRLKKATLDVINQVIFTPGNDLYGGGILDYYYDESTRASDVRAVYRVWTDLSKKIKALLLEVHSAQFSLVTTETSIFDSTLSFNDKRYVVSFPFTPFFSSRSVQTTNELNKEFVAYCKRLGKQQAQRVTRGSTALRWKGSITLQGEKVVAGQLVVFASTTHGIRPLIARITEVVHTIDRAGWGTTIKIEEDPLGLGG